MILRWLGSVLAVARLTVRRTFLARRSLWVYLLAFAPLALFTVHSIYASRDQDRLTEIGAQHQTTARALRAVRVGQSLEEVVERLGEPYHRRSWTRPGESGHEVARDILRYTDGRTEYTFRFAEGRLTRINRDDPESLDTSLKVFATIFQVYYLRLAVFFGCIGVFSNLFRGEMLDRSLHYALLSPVRRDALVAGKYLAGMAATVVIFGTSAALQFWAMLLQFDGPTIAGFLGGEGWGQWGAYIGTTALACAAYGGVFLGAGLMFRNPIIPAAIVLLWESASLFVPVTLKKLGLIYYLQSLCPIIAEPDEDMPVALRLLVADAAPVSSAAAIGVILAVTVVMVGAAGVLARRLEINYATD